MTFFSGSKGIVQLSFRLSAQFQSLGCTVFPNSLTMSLKQRWDTLQVLGCPSDSRIRAGARAAGLFHGDLNDLWIFLSDELSRCQEQLKIAPTLLDESVNKDEQELIAVQVIAFVGIHNSALIVENLQLLTMRLACAGRSSDLPGVAVRQQQV